MLRRTRIETGEEVCHTWRSRQLERCHMERSNGFEHRGRGTRVKRNRWIVEAVATFINTNIRNIQEGRGISNC